MGGAERVVLALSALGENRQPARVPQGPDSVPPAGQDLVWVGLMPYVPDQSVVGSIEDVVQGDGEFDDAQPRPQMTPGGCDRVDGLGAQLIGNLTQVALVKPPQIRRIDDCI